MISARMVAADATEKMIVDMSPGKMSSRITDILRRAGGQASRREVMRALGRSVRRMQDVTDVAKVLEEQGVILVSQVPNDKGPPTIRYSLVVP